MKKYASLIATPIIVLYYKVSVIGISSGELAITAIPVNIILYGFMIMIIPIIIAANNKDGFSLEVFNKYNYYTLGLFILLVIVPHIYTNKELKAQSEWKTTTENYQSSDNESHHINSMLEAHNMGPNTSSQIKPKGWVRDTVRNAVSLNLPKKLRLATSKIPKGHEGNMLVVEAHISKAKSFNTLVSYIYYKDLARSRKEASEGGLKSWVEFAGGKDLKLSFKESNDINKGLLVSGSFYLNEIKHIIEAYSYSDHSHTLIAVNCIGKPKYKKSMLKVINSIQIH